MNWLQGAVTLYITVTFLVYAAVLDGLYTPPTLIDYIVDVTTHFVMPISTIFGWIFTGRRIRYSWKILPIWIIYPILYLLFALIHGTITGDYLYPFLNIEKLGKWAFLVSVLILIGVYLGLGSIYIVINRKSTKKGKN